MQLESTTPSTSHTVAGRGGQKKRKREESGKCDECGKGFCRKSDAKRHKSTVHEKEENVCELCNIPCCRKDTLQRHMEAQHNLKDQRSDSQRVPEGKNLLQYTQDSD